MGIRFPWVPEESVWNPNFSNHIAIKHKDFHWAVKFQTTVIPSLGKYDIYGVFLKTEKRYLCTYLSKPAKPRIFNWGINQRLSLLFSLLLFILHSAACSRLRKGTYSLLPLSPLSWDTPFSQRRGDLIGSCNLAALTQYNQTEGNRHRFKDNFSSSELGQVSRDIDLHLFKSK